MHTVRTPLTFYKTAPYLVLLVQQREQTENHCPVDEDMDISVKYQCSDALSSIVHGQLTTQ